MYKKRQAVLGVAVIAMGISGLAIAQDDKYSNEATVFEEVIVTATKREQSIYDVPMAVTAFTADMIEKQYANKNAEPNEYWYKMESYHTLSIIHTPSGIPGMSRIFCNVIHLIVAPASSAIYS